MSYRVRIIPDFDKALKRLPQLNSKNSYVNSIFVSGNDLYVVAGYGSNGTHTVAKHWKNAQLVTLKILLLSASV